MEERKQQAESATPPPPQPEIVELATLFLPRSAIEVGLEVGDGNHFVLEASHELVEQLQVAMATAAAVDEEDGITTDDSTAFASTNISERPLISAVVDLEKLSELVGGSKTDLISGLQQEMQEKRSVPAEEAEEEVEQDKADVAPDEKTPFISKTSHCDVADSTVADTVRTAQGSVKVLETSSTLEQITLSADPFLENLVFPTIHYDDMATVGAESTLYGEAITIATTTIAFEDMLKGIARAQAGEALEHREEHHFAHDAFLLDVPTTDDQGTLEHHFVLALPEIMVDESVHTATSVLSDDEASFTLMERAMSFLPATTRLPTDIENIHLEAMEHILSEAGPSQVRIDVVINRRVPVIGYVILFSGLFALASVGAALDLQQGGVTPAMKTLWRQLATSLVLLPFAMKSLYCDGRPKLTPSQWSILPMASAAYAYVTLAFVISLEMTTMANAFVLSNMTSLVIIFGRSVMGMPVTPLEGGGAVTGFFGAAICAQDATRTMAAGGEAKSSTWAANDTPHLGMWGNVVALSVSFGTAIYLLIAKKLRPKMDLFVFIFIIMACGSMFLLVFMIVIGEEVTFNMHPIHGLFGWMTLKADRLPLEMFLAIVCNCLGTTGYIAVMKYFDPLVPATVMLLEPAIGALFGVAAGTANLPGLQTWLGDLGKYIM
jgi:drug/metabolite transporter (DMT)-like permease